MIFGKAPVCLRVYSPPDLCIVGKVDNPELAVKPVTPIEIGVELLFSDDNLPNDKLPMLLLLVLIPVFMVASDGINCALHTIVPLTPVFPIDTT